MPYEEVETDDEDEFIEHGLDDDFDNPLGSADKVNEKDPILL